MDDADNRESDANKTLTASSKPDPELQAFWGKWHTRKSWAGTIAIYGVYLGGRVQTWGCPKTLAFARHGIEIIGISVFVIGWLIAAAIQTYLTIKTNKRYGYKWFIWSFQKGLDRWGVFMTYIDSKQWIPILWLFPAVAITELIFWLLP